MCSIRSSSVREIRASELGPYTLNRSVGGYSPVWNGAGWSGSEGGIVGVKRGDIEGEVGLCGAGLYDTKKTALVKAPDTR